VSEGARLGIALLVAATLPAATVPVAIAIARRTGFLDSPVGYKAHRRPTPYLGGIAVLLATLAAISLFDSRAWAEYWPLLTGTCCLSLIGTIDDRVNLSPLLRVGVELLAAYLLWAEGLGWAFLGSGSADLLLTALWVVAIVNAFNLMDNLDGAAASVAAVSAACIAVLATIGDDPPLALISIALCGALIGFLRFNLARPSRIFLGDGGSMAIGFLIAGALMSVPMDRLAGWATFVAAGLVVGLPAFDTALVVISRRRRQAPVFSGATDHTTHRLRAALKSPRAVAAALAAVQACLGGLAIEASRLGESALIALACAVLLIAAASIAVAEGLGWAPLSEDP
jgi:UDP-GlcNAc:undecaprenyl-phosphate/decaprenyl-phosphate GlcNAc-1-phosphate transferase